VKQGSSERKWSTKSRRERATKVIGQRHMQFLADRKRARQSPSPNHCSATRSKSNSETNFSLHSRFSTLSRLNNSHTLTLHPPVVARIHKSQSWHLQSGVRHVLAVRARPPHSASHHCAVTNVTATDDEEEDSTPPSSPPSKPIARRGKFDDEEEDDSDVRQPTCPALHNFCPAMHKGMYTDCDYRC